MIINTGSRTDIPAFFSEWFYNRIKAGFVLVRNPYDPMMVTRYVLDPSVVDAISFCTKNPAPMLPGLHELDRFKSFFMVTITPYGREIEPLVPDKNKVVESFKALSEYAGKNAMSWRYDPVFISEKYSVEFHKRAFADFAEKLHPYTSQCVVSFIDLYEKTKMNFPEAKHVSKKEQEELIDSFSETVRKYGMQIHLCLEDAGLIRDNVDADGCYSQAVMEKAIGEHLTVPNAAIGARKGCRCLLGSDIGAYNTCAHGCLYCYANYDMEIVHQNMRWHDPESPLLIGHLHKGDMVRDAKQKSWIDPQLNIFDFISR